MNKKSYLTSALLVGGLLIGGLTAQAQNRTVKLTTSKAAGSEITLLVNRTYSGVTVDWGDGEAQTYNTGDDAIREITGTVKGSTITITGTSTWKMLSCAGCGITDIDLSGAQELQSLYCQDNELTAIDLRGMSQLTDLNCANNQLTSITYTNTTYPERDLAAMENINLSNNQLSGTFVVRTSTMHSIDISNNNFTTLYTSSNPNLDVLKCSNNQLKGRLQLNSNTALTTLMCNDNAFTEISLPSNASNLRQVLCDNNQIASTLNLQACSELSDVSCTNNLLTTLYLPTNKKTSSLNLSNNKLTFGALPRRNQRPAYLAFMPQEPVDISGLENMLSKDGVPYVELATWSTRRENQIDMSNYRTIAASSSSAGTAECDITWYRENADGTIEELLAGRQSSAPNDYFAQGVKYTFFTAQPKAFGRIKGTSVYKNDDFYIETTRFAIGEGSVTGIGTITGQADGLQLEAARGTLTMSSAAPVAISIYAADGKQVWSGSVSATVTLNLPSGIYIVNGSKVAL